MKLLVIRFSALGDVAMTVPVLYSLADQYPDLRITMLSKDFVAPLYERMPSNVRFKGIDLRRYQGLGGLYRLFRLLKQDRFDAVADLHDVLRSRIIRFFFWIVGVKAAHIDKGRKEKRALVRSVNKRLKQLPTSFERYVAVLRKLGYPVGLHFRSIYGEEKGDADLFVSLADVKQKKHWVGIAPFAAHAGKVLPQETVKELIGQLLLSDDNRLFLFGGGEEETAKLHEWAADRPQVTVVAGKLKLNGELALMSYLDVLVSMDSANMHLASLVGIPVVSVWGATHPYAGFMGWNQCMAHAVQVDLPCRPCSVFGNQPCLRKDYACLRRISVEMIMSKINKILAG